MGGTVTGTSVLSNSVQNAFDSDYELEWVESAIWAPIVNWRGTVEATPSNTIAFPVYEPLEPNTTALTETADVDPNTIDDTTVSVTIREYGDVVQRTKFLKIVSYADVDGAIRQMVAKSHAKAIDKLVRAEVIGNTDVMYPVATSSARTDLDASSYLPTYDFVAQLVARANARGIPSFDDGTFVSFIHPLGVQQLRKLTEITAVGEYSDPGLIYRGVGGIGGKKYPNEKFQIAGLRIVEHPLGKLYLSGGKTPQTATAITTGHALTAGDTTVYVDELTGLAAGSYCTLGTLESATAEQVLITAASGSSGAGTITIRGAGNIYGNWGCKYAHAAGAAVTEAANVFAIPVLGPKSICGYYSSDTGKLGKKGISVPVTNIPDRFMNWYWYWVGGIAKMDKWIVRGEAATAYGTLGSN